MKYVNQLYLEYEFMKIVFSVCMVKSCGKSTKCHFSAFISYHYEIGSAAGHYFIPVGGAPFMNTVTTNIMLTKSAK